MKKYLHRLIYHIKLSGKMALLYTFFLSLVCILSLVALQASLNIYDKKLYEKSMQELDYFSQQVNNSLEEIQTLSVALCMDTEVQKQLTALENTAYMSAEYSVELYHLYELMMEELNLHSNIKNIIYTDKKEVFLKAGADAGRIPKARQEELLRLFAAGRGAYVTCNPTEEYPYFLSGRDILESENASLDYMGSLIITSDVSQIIQQNISELKTPHSTLFVSSDEGVIYEEEGEMNPNLQKLGDKNGYQILRQDGEKYFICYLQDSLNGWKYVNVFPYSEIFGQIVMIRYLLLGGMFILFFVTTVVLRKQVYENYEKQILLKDTKYKMLRAQINPHFLYNTLNTLGWMIKGKQNEEAEKVLIKLGALLRYSFAEEACSTIAEEVETTRKYIAIQSFRYKNRAVFSVAEQGNLADYMIPKMVLQPLVENAIKYGVNASLEVCTIQVRAVEEEEKIILEVEDDGPGMSAEDLEKLRNNQIRPKGHGIGIQNIRERLKQEYEDVEFQIDSKPGEGMKICITIVKPEVKKRGKKPKGLKKDGD